MLASSPPSFPPTTPLKRNTTAILVEHTPSPSATHGQRQYWCCATACNALSKFLDLLVYGGN